MLNYAIIFLIIALLAGILGFGGIAGTAATIAKVLFVIFLVLFLVSLLRGAVNPPLQPMSGSNLSTSFMKSKISRHTPKELLNELQTLVAEAESMMANSLSENSAEAFSALRKRFGETRERFTDAYDGTKKKVIAGVECTDATIRANPYQTVAIAVGVALIAGVLLGRRKQ